MIGGISSGLKSRAEVEAASRYRYRYPHPHRPRVIPGGPFTYITRDRFQRAVF